MARRRERAVHDMAGRVVSAHRVNGDPDQIRAPRDHGADEDPSVFLDRAGLASPVVAAVGADAVRRLGLVALRAFAEADRRQCVVRPALGGARLGVSSLWIRHISLDESVRSVPGAGCLVLGVRMLSVCSVSVLSTRPAAGLPTPAVQSQVPRFRFVPQTGTGRGTRRCTTASSASTVETVRASAGRGRSCRSRKTPS